MPYRCANLCYAMLPYAMGFLFVCFSELSDNHPPCIRVIVLESGHLLEGSLHIITCTGGVIGRLKTSALEIPDINVSKVPRSIFLLNKQWDFYLSVYKLTSPLLR